MPEYVKPEWGIPHCKFSMTASGFKVEYEARSYAAMGGLYITAIGGGAFFIVVFLVMIANAFTKIVGDVFGMALISGIVGFIVTWGVRLIRARPTTIEVTSDEVLIGDKAYNRMAFGPFHIKTTINHPKVGEVANLGFNYGNQSLPLPGVWPAAQATEFLASLNKRLREIPEKTNKYAPSPEILRATRPSDF